MRENRPPGGREGRSRVQATLHGDAGKKKTWRPWVINFGAVLRSSVKRHTSASKKKNVDQQGGNDK